MGENVFVKCKVLSLHVTTRHKQVLAHHNHTHSPRLPVILFVYTFVHLKLKEAAIF